MPRAVRGGCLLPTVATLICGCATNAALLSGEPSGSPLDAVELEETPFFPQTDNLCGPAALATVLTQSGVEVGIDAARSAVYIPEREGSLQLELVAAIRGYGRLPYQIDPSMAALVAELHAGRPVLILQNLGFRMAPIWHYAVVVGYQPEKKRVVLRSGDVERYVISEARFIRSWERANYWGVAVLRTDELPAVADESRYLKTAAILESMGQYDAALRAYETALRRWPASVLALLGLGNAHYARGDLAEAERAYRNLLRRDPNHMIALNNLAQTLADEGCVREAMTTIGAAIDLSEMTDPLSPSLVETRDLISALPQTACPN
jgi:tetratricopeptide (TPR) repeat protein